MRVEATIMGLKLVGTTGRGYSKEEFFQRAEAIYAKIKDQVNPGNDGKFLSIDIETGEYEIDEKGESAVDRLFARLDDPQIFTYRIGYTAAASLGGSPKRIVS